MTKKATIEAKNISKKYLQADTTITVLNDINLVLEQGNSYALRGMSGTGKSTLLYILAGLEVPSEGSILFNDINLADLHGKEREVFFNKYIGLVFQWPYLIRELSVLENIMLPGIIGGKSSEECKDRAYELLESVGLAQKAKNSPVTLSGGQQQRVSIARSIFNRPLFLLADEPTGSLDVHTGETIIDLILSLREKWGIGIIISTHDEYVSDKMHTEYIIVDGHIQDARSAKH